MRVYSVSVVSTILFIFTINARAETVSGQRTTSPAAIPYEPPPEQGRIAEELTCAVINTVDSPPEAIARAKEYGKQFEAAWRRLSELGYPFPSEAERAHFYSQILYESKNLQWLVERDARHSHIIHGEKWRGRGPIQLTQCYNYAAFAQFTRRLEKGVKGRKLLEQESEVADLSSGRRYSRCPPDDVKDHAIMAEPDIVFGNSPLDGHYLSALSAVWWWEDRKSFDRKFKANLQKSDDKTVEVVTKSVKGSFETSDRRMRKFNAVQQCIRNHDYIHGKKR